MLNTVITWSLRHRLVVVLAWLGVVGAGLLAFRRLPIDAFPDTTPVLVQVNTNASALSPLEVERQITTRIEQAISGLPGLTEVRSISKFGLSQVTVTFTDGTDIYLARQVVKERIDSVKLPRGVESPTLVMPSMRPSPPGLGRMNSN